MKTNYLGIASIFLEEFAVNLSLAYDTENLHTLYLPPCRFCPLRMRLILFIFFTNEQPRRSSLHTFGRSLKKH